MADKTRDAADPPRKSAKIPLITGLVLALAGGGGGFYAVWAGLLFPAESAEAHGSNGDAGHPAAVGDLPDVAYVPVDPLVISLGDGVSGRHLRFRAELEVAPAHRSEVERVMPRVVDVLNSYLRAVDFDDLTDSAALLRLRSQMLRRLQIVTGGERINDLLIMEFVIN